jgi:hypothetical protein
MEGAVIAEETTVKIRELRGTAALSSYIWCIRPVSGFRPHFENCVMWWGEMTAPKWCVFWFTAHSEGSLATQHNKEHYKQATSWQMLLFIHKERTNALRVGVGDTNSVICAGNRMWQVSVPLQYFQGLTFLPHSTRIKVNLREGVGRTLTKRKRHDFQVHNN